MIDIKKFLQADNSDDFTTNAKDHMTKLAFEKLDVIKQEMAKDYLKSDENEPS
tara:strand:+ start:1676 stop:1834 length:159 start_codon:yes stop_codon:yes gene_type:complete